MGVFLLYNLLDLAGRSLATSLPAPPPTLCLLLALARLGFIPVFLLCNLSPSNREVTSVLLTSDTALLVTHALFSLSSGYLTTTAMMTGPGLVGEQSRALAASVMVFCLVLGLLLGAATSYLWVKLL